MLEVMQFIFSSFWVWLGTFLLVAIAANGISGGLSQSGRKK